MRAIRGREGKREERDRNRLCVGDGGRNGNGSRAGERVKSVESDRTRGAKGEGEGAGDADVL